MAALLGHLSENRMICLVFLREKSVISVPYRLSVHSEGLSFFTEGPETHGLSLS